MKLICFDCDSTLSSIEGIDELARLAGNDVFAEVEALTHAAMNGDVPVEEVFTRRLDLIQPTAAQCAEVGQLYCNTILPGVENTIKALQADGWECQIISGGFTEAILPLAKKLGIEKVHAVGLHFNQDGSYKGFQKDAFTARSGGKPDCLKEILAELQPDKSVMVGDGASDLETNTVVDRFIGFGAVIAREKVEKEAEFFTKDFTAIQSLCQF